jgi:RNA polymerase sigma-70 factor (ECF subfamily)
VAFLERSTHNQDQARELAHEFFARLLGRHGLDGADPQRGRFRTYLLGAIKHFLANQRAAASREKRGGHVVHETIPVDTSSGREISDPGVLPPDELFDREWALNILQRALCLLAQEADSTDTSPQFQALKPWLTGERPDLTQAEVAASLAMTEGAVRVTIYRLRMRFRQLVKAEISCTVDPPATVDDELRHLVKVLAHPPRGGTSA